MSDKIFWFVLALFNLIAGVFSILYFPSYRKEAVFLCFGVTFLLYSIWFILVAGVLTAPEQWLTWIGVALLGSFPPLIALLVWSVLFRDNDK